MNTILTKLRHEPVAFYGGLLSALLVVLALLGVSADTLATVGTVAGLVGIPITRAQVTPTVKRGGDGGEVSFGLLAMVAVITFGVFLGLTLHDWLYITHR